MSLTRRTLLSMPAAAAAAQANRPNVLLIMADDFGYECMSGNGDRKSVV